VTYATRGTLLVETVQAATAGIGCTEVPASQETLLPQLPAPTLLHFPPTARRLAIMDALSVFIASTTTMASVNQSVISAVPGTQTMATARPAT